MYLIVNEQVRQNAINEIQDAPLGKISVKIEPLKRSLDQNALYWKYVGIIADELGYHPDELHESFKGEFIGMENGRDMFDNIFIKPRSSRKLTKEEFTLYLNKVQAFAISMNLLLPSKEHYGY